MNTPGCCPVVSHTDSEHIDLSQLWVQHSVEMVVMKDPAPLCLFEADTSWKALRAEPSPAGAVQSMFHKHVAGWPLPLHPSPAFSPEAHTAEEPLAPPWKPQCVCLPPCKAGQPSTISCSMQGLHHKGLPRDNCIWFPVAYLILRWLHVAHPVSCFPMDSASLEQVSVFISVSSGELNWEVSGECWWSTW